MRGLFPSSIIDHPNQVYIALSSMTKWATMSGDVNLSSLYDLLREQFRNPEDPWYKDTIKWWNEYVQKDHSSWPTAYKLSISNVFPNASSAQEPHDLRETEGLTTREQMELEQQERISQAASETGGRPGV